MVFKKIYKWVIIECTAKFMHMYYIIFLYNVTHTLFYTFYRLLVCYHIQLTLFISNRSICISFHLQFLRLKQKSINLKASPFKHFWSFVKCVHLLIQAYWMVLLFISVKYMVRWPVTESSWSLLHFHMDWESRDV